MAVPNFDNLIIDHPLRVRMHDNSMGEMMYVVNQIKEATLTNGANQIFLTGTAGVRIATLQRDKSTSFSFQNGLVSMSAMATQIGSEKEIASSESKIKVPMFEIIKIGSSDGSTPNKTITLQHIPVGIKGKEIPFIYLALKDKAQGQKFAIGTVASATEFSLKPDTRTITLPVGANLTAEDSIIVDYTYESENGIRVVNRGDVHAKSGRVIADFLLRDVCDNNKKYYASLILPNVTTSGQFDMNFGNEGVVHNWSCEANQDLCSDDKELFSWVIPME